MKGSKPQFALALLVLWAGSAYGVEREEDFISPECESLAKQYLFEGDVHDTGIGARFWNLTGIAKSEKSDSQEPCMKQIWKQAVYSQNNYWIQHVAKSYHCINPGEETVPATAPSTCANGMWTAVRTNMDFIDMISTVWAKNHGNGATVSTADPCTNPADAGLRPAADTMTAGTQVAAQLQQQFRQETAGRPAGTQASGTRPPANVNGARAPAADHPGAAQPPAPLNTGVTPDDLSPAPEAQQPAQADTTGRCEGIPKQDLKEKFGGPPESPVSAEELVGKCLAGMGRGILNNFRDMVDGLWDMAKGVWKGATKKVPAGFMRLVEGGYNGSMAAFARELFFHPEDVLAKVLDFLKKVPAAILGVIDDQIREAACLNDAAKAKWVCKGAAYAGTDLFFLVPGLQEVAIGKIAGNIPGIARMVDEMRVLKRAKIIGPEEEEAGKVAKTAVRLGDAVALVQKLAEITGDAAKSLANKPFIPDISSHMQVFVDNGKVFLKNTAGKIFEVVPDALKNRILSAWQKYQDGRKMAAEDRDIEARVKNAQQAYKMSGNEGKLAKGFKPDTPESRRLVGYEPTDWSKALGTIGKDAKRNAEFLGMKVVEEPTASLAGLGGKYVVKDAQHVERVFTRVQHTDGSWWMVSGPKIPTGVEKFGVSIDVIPKNIDSLLPEVMTQASRRGGMYFEVGASEDALKSGKRMTVWFTDATKAQEFADGMAPKITSNFCLHSGAGVRAWVGTCMSIRTIGGSMGRMAGRSSVRWAKRLALTGNQCHGDPVCQCHIYLSAETNPETYLPISISPFHCDANGFVADTRGQQPDKPTLTAASETEPAPERGPAGAAAPAPQPEAPAWPANPNRNDTPPQGASKTPLDANTLALVQQCRHHPCDDKPLTYGQLDDLIQSHEQACGIQWTDQQRVEFKVYVVAQWVNKLQQKEYEMKNETKAMPCSTDPDRMTSD